MEECQADHGHIAQSEVEWAGEAWFCVEVVDSNPEDVGAKERFDSDDQDTKSCSHFNALAFGVSVSYHCSNG